MRGLVAASALPVFAALSRGLGWLRTSPTITNGSNMRQLQDSVAEEWSNISADMAKMVTGFGPFVSHLIEREQQQYLFACFALGNVTALDRNWQSALAIAIMQQRRRILLSNLVGQRVGETACHVLY
jgi:hypothetical protein